MLKKYFVWAILLALLGSSCALDRTQIDQDSLDANDSEIPEPYSETPLQNLLSSPDVTPPDPDQAVIPENPPPTFPSSLEPETPEVEVSRLSGTIEVFEDFECSWCRHFERETIALLRTKHPRVQIVLRHFPMTSPHPHAEEAAKYSICAEQQGKGAEMNAALFAATDLTAAGLQKLAADLQLDSTLLTNCLTSAETMSRISADIQRGRELGVRGTPTFFIAGQKYEGSYPLENVEKYLRDAE